MGSGNEIDLWPVICTSRGGLSMKRNEKCIANEYMKDHIFELQRKICRHD